MKHSLLFATTALLLIFGSAATTAPDAGGEIIATLNRMWSAQKAGDVDGYLEYIHPDFTHFGETAHYLGEGKELEARNVSRWLKDVESIHTDMHHPNVTVRGNTAWITYYWSDYVKYKGTDMITSGGKSTRIFVKENGRWLCIHAHHTYAPGIDL